MNRLVIAFEGETAISRVYELLASASLVPKFSLRTGAEVIRAVQSMGGGTVVCGCKFPDMTADQLCNDLEGQARILVIGKPQQLELCESPDIFRLPLPINRYDLAASVNMLLQLEEMSAKRRNRRGNTENTAIARAKHILGLTFGMSEPEAHRYLQKHSMDSGRRMTETAEMIIEKYAKDI